MFNFSIFQLHIAYQIVKVTMNKALSHETFIGVSRINLRYYKYWDL